MTFNKDPDHLQGLANRNIIKEPVLLITGSNTLSLPFLTLMPELQNKSIAADPIATHGATDGHYQKLPARRVTVEEMLAAAAAKKAGGSVPVGVAVDKPAPEKKRKAGPSSVADKEDRGTQRRSGKKPKKGTTTD
ncbi:hypothetical protein FRC11_008151 [Ceratobasidium sp. 423]|nr:hypothetical protein FRC11_008151 [Ceratobasidium sp. 423]